ncbi:MAG: response regulator [Lachnospiraceae bacterium]|nr:response regulator [Lachnospiraceae bacterium]
MFRILIADDEGIMRDSIKNTIQSTFGSECEIETVRTGREVIEHAASFHPDIAFVDIQMPGISGIQAISEVQKFNTSIVFIIITAYDRFSYAQEAINLGVMDYITKPINKKKIIDVCTRAMQKVEESRQKRSDDLRVREKLEIVIPMIETAFVSNLLQEDKADTLENYLEMLDIHSAFGYLVVLEFGDLWENGVLTNAVGSNVKVNNQFSRVKEVIYDFLSCIIGPVMGNRIILFVPKEHDHSEYEERVEIITRIRNMIRRLEGDLELTFRAGIGDIVKVAQSYTSYQQAIRCLRKSDGHIVHIADLSVAAEDNTGYPQETESRFVQYAMRGDAENATSSAKDLIRWMHEHGSSREDVELKILELLLRLERKSKEAGIIKMDFHHKENYITEIRALEDQEAAGVWLAHQIRLLCDEIETTKEAESDSVVSKVTAYVKEHFAEEISLDDMARMVDISPYYFSKLFKKETGENFIEYLNYTRIVNAKLLLANPKYTIKEVCVMCGYSDPNYFSRIFRKYEGVSPSEFRG